MKCARARDSIAEYVDGDLGPIGRGRIGRHLASCADCARTLAEERRLRAALGTWSDEAPSDVVWPHIRARAGPALSGSVAPPASPPAPAWRWLGVALWRPAVPYLLGAATAVIVMVGAGFERVGGPAGEADPPAAAAGETSAPGPFAPVVHEDLPAAAGGGGALFDVDPYGGTTRRRSMRGVRDDRAGPASYGPGVVPAAASRSSQKRTH